MRLYKLTDAAGFTRRGTSGETLWSPGKTVTIPDDERGTELCEAGVLHVYPDSVLAVLMDLAHGQYLPGGRMLVCEGDVVVSAPDKMGCHSIRAVEWMAVPEVTDEQRLRFGILAAQAVIGDVCPKWSAWAERWLSGEDRSVAAARAARAAAKAAARAAKAAARAAEAAAWAAWAVDAAAWAAWAVDAAAWAARAADPTIDLVEIARRAVDEEPMPEGQDEEEK